MATTASNLLPLRLQDALERLTDDLQRAVDGVLVPTEVGRLAALAAPMIGELTAEGAETQARFLADAVREMREADALWAQILGGISGVTRKQFDDAVYQAYDNACWALTWTAAPPLMSEGVKVQLL